MFPGLDLIQVQSGGGREALQQRFQEKYREVPKEAQAFEPSVSVQVNPENRNASNLVNVPNVLTKTLGAGLSNQWH